MWKSNSVTVCKYKINKMNKKIFSCILIMFFLTGCARSSSSSAKLVVRKDASNKILTISNETASSIGLKIETAEIKKVNFKLIFNGIVKEVPNKTFFVASPVNGRVSRVYVEPNQIISQSTQLAEISSQDVAELQFDINKELIDLEGEIEQARLELGLAKGNFERESKLYEDGITAKKDFLEAETRFKRAETNLQILEKKKESITELSEKRLSILGAHIDSPNTLAGFVEVRSPGGGIILKRLINPGEVVEKDKVLFEASDLKEVFVESQIYEKDFPKINLGEKVSFTTEACPNQIFNGEVNFISQLVDPQTRTIAVRAKIQNPAYKLKPETFGKMYISLDEKEALVINKESVQKVDNMDFVYVKTPEGYKEVETQLGKETDGHIEVLSGVKAGQNVVTQGSYWLKSELHSD